MDSIETVEDIWTKQIRPTLERIFETNSYGVQEYSYIYSSVFNFVRKYHQSETNIYRLYFKLEDFFISFCNSLVEKSAGLVDEDFLRFFSAEWKKYRRYCHFLHDTFDRAHRYFGYRYIYNEGNPIIIYPISVLAIITWKLRFCDKNYRKMVEAALKSLSLDRQGETVDSSLILNVVRCYVKVGIFQGIGESYFETLFVKEAERFYDLESTALFQNISATEYMKEVMGRFHGERKRLSHYLRSSTEENFKKILHRLFIDRYLEFFYAEFKNLLVLEKYYDIKLMYSSVLIYVKDLSKYVEFFEKLVFDEGLASIEGCGESVKKNPKMFMDAILVVHNKYFNLIKYAFDCDELFLTGLEQAAKRFVNKNFVTFAPNTARKVSGLVSKYCDELLSKSDSNQKEDLEEVLIDVGIVFYFIEDKDIFLAQYMKLFARRLVNNMSKSEELESKMIEIMMQVISDGKDDYIRKFLAMLEDIKLSRDINQEFSREPLDLDCNVMVLRSSSWPLQTWSTLTLPLQLQKCVARFSTFYKKKHESKKLSWIHDVSRGEILTKNFKNGYTIQASTPQIAILLLFNSSPAWTVAKIQEETSIDLNVIVPNVLIMIKAKLLTSDEVENLTKDTVICINPSYHNKKHCININVPIKTEPKKEEEASDKNIDETRKMVIQATIVRIMKLRGTLKNQELISEVILNLTSQFKPNFEMITKCIHLLVGKQYMEFSSTDENTLNYLA